MLQCTSVQYRHHTTPLSSDISESYEPLIARLLASRGIAQKNEAELFFAKDYEEGLHDPFLLPDMERTVSRIIRAIQNDEHIAIYSDYDCDGIPGATLWHDFFTAIGYINFSVTIPHRHHDGYGLSMDAIDRVCAKEARVLITVDCGTTDHDEVLYATSRGLDVIVTDHHEVGEILPSAYACVNPKRHDSEYPFRELCGSGVVFKVLCAIISRESFSLSRGWEKWLLDMVGLATIADMVPLIDENRIFAHYGLVVMKKGRRIGLQKICESSALDSRHITEDDIAFLIAPRINAASRMGVSEDAFFTLTEKDESRASAYARKLEHNNNERKGIVASMVKDAYAKLERLAPGPVVVVGDASWRPSLAGLAATALLSEFNRPVFVWGRDGNNVLKGSCRSATVSVVSLMNVAQDAFLECGGHHLSGGFAVREEHIHTLGDVLNAAFHTLAESSAEEDTERFTYIDAVLSLDDVGEGLVRELERFAPFGIQNHKPLFLFPSVAPHTVTVFGKQKAHTKALFQTRRGFVEAIGFFKLPPEYGVALSPHVPVDLVAHVERSYFGGRMNIRLRIIDVISPGSTA